MHSATVQNADCVRTGCVVYEAASRPHPDYGSPDGYVFDECHVDKSGRWVLLHESRLDGARRNRIVELHNGRITTITDVNGALDFMTLRVLARSFTPVERKIVVGAYQDFVSHYRASPAEADKLLAVGESPADGTLPSAEFAALTMVANQIFSLDEALNK